MVRQPQTNQAVLLVGETTAAVGTQPGDDDDDERILIEGRPWC